MRKGDVLELAEPSSSLTRDTRETSPIHLFTSFDDNQLLPQLGDYEIGSLLGTGSWPRFTVASTRKQKLNMR